jgi:hypothetical protein
MPYPGYLRLVADAAFGTPFTRVTYPSRLRPLFVLRHATLDRTDTACVITTIGAQLHRWTEHHRPGHGDMTMDTDGSDVLLATASPALSPILRPMATASALRSTTSIVPAGSS